jgi:hypothetical protein
MTTKTTIAKKRNPPRERVRLLKSAAFAIVNRNLLNYPLARDTRVKVHWHEKKRRDGIGPTCLVTTGSCCHSPRMRTGDVRMDLISTCCSFC